MIIGRLRDKLTLRNAYLKPTRTVLDDQCNPWFVAKDVCDALGFDHTPSAVRSLDEDEKGVRNVHTPGGEQTMTIINESGLYSLILRSRKAEAKRFKKWVTSEVLPAIRKKGYFVAPEIEKADPTITQRLDELAAQVSMIAQQNATLAPAAQAWLLESIGTLAMYPPWHGFSVLSLPPSLNPSTGGIAHVDLDFPLVRA